MTYELMVVVNPTVDIDPVISRLEKSVKETNATGVKINKLGKKPLSYQIAKHAEGEYLLVNFEAGGEAVGAISKQLRLEQEAVLRYLIVKTKVSQVSKVPKVSKEISKSKQQELVKPKVTVKTVSSKEKKAERKVTKVPKVSKGLKEKGTKGTGSTKRKKK